MKAAVVCANEDVRYMDYEEPQVTPTVERCVKPPVSVGPTSPESCITAYIFIRSYWDMSFSGDVVEVGEGVTTIKVGDHVSGAPLVPLYEM